MEDISVYFVLQCLDAVDKNAVNKRKTFNENKSYYLSKYENSVHCK